MSTGWAELNCVSKSLVVRNFFCPTGVLDPFDTVSWESRDAEIRDEQGQPLFVQRGCQIPATWSTLATNVVVSKYFFGEPGTEQRETSVRQLIHRVVRTIADWGVADGYFESEEVGDCFCRELIWLCLHQFGSFNSPVWFNVGLHQQYSLVASPSNWNWNETANAVVVAENPYERPQCSACFIQSVSDELEAIMNLAVSEAMLFKYGSGTGTDLSTIRSTREKLAGGGRPSGPLSFMRVYDQIAGVVKSGGKTRRAAKMQSLKVEHPDILEFIECKWREEKKARILIEKGGYEANFNGEAYASIMFQNANLSVRLSDRFMNLAESDGVWQTIWVTDPDQRGPQFQARELLRAIAESTWQCGDPGVQFDTTINHWHTCPNAGRINASNPCSEYMFLDNSACNLASLNLMKFRQSDGTFDSAGFVEAARLFFIAQEILIDRSSYPTREITKNSHDFRPLGLGYTNLGSLLMASGLAYDSDAGRGLCSAITAILTGAAYRTSAELASVRGAFAEFESNRQSMLAVIEQHRKAVGKIGPNAPAALRTVAQAVWREAVDLGHTYGFRNAQTTVLAPTGTISFMMDCDTTGIEPDIALVKFKHLAGGGVFKMVNQTVRLALESLRYGEPEIERIIRWINEHDTIEGAADLRVEHLPIFDCALRSRHGQRFIAWQAHVAMMAAAQPFISGAISKTVNMPNEATVDDIAEAYQWAWKLGLKALAIYRDGSKQSQPVEAARSEQSGEVAESSRPQRRRLPNTRRSITHKFRISGHEGYFTVGLYDDGQPGELFVTMAKEGSTVGGLMDAFGTSISIALQYGVPLSVLFKKFSHSRFEPQGITDNPEIRFAKSIVDYIFRWLALEFLPGFRKDEVDFRPEANPGSEPSLARQFAEASVPSSSESSPDVIAAASHYDSSAGHSSSRFAQRPANAHSTESPAVFDPELPAIQAARKLFPAYSDFAGDGGGPLWGIVGLQVDAPCCDNCGSITVRCGSCYLCHCCGTSLGCS